MDQQLHEVSDGVYAHIRPDGSWWINNSGLLVGSTTGVKQTGEVVIEFLGTLLVYNRGHGPRFEEA
ncbi:MAG: hypothetical protein L0I24_05125 [Pseudonocardia sp.]|nr:hypothetical protein [Pseudonocardia sp.]